MAPERRGMRLKTRLLTCLVLGGSLWVAGCAAILDPNRERNNLLFTDKEIDEIFKSYQKDATQAKERRAVELKGAVKRVDVTRKEGEKDFLVSVHLENASLKEVVEIILAKTEIPFFLQDVKLAGLVSGRFENVPFIRAINIILNSEGYSASMSEEGILFIRASYDGPGAPAAPAPETAPPPPPPSAPGPGPASGVQPPSRFSDSFPPAMFRRTTLMVQNVPQAPAAPPQPPGLPLPQPPGAPLPEPPGFPLPQPPGLPLPEPPGASRKPPQPEMSVEYPLQHLNTESADKILSRLFPSDAAAGALPGAIPGIGIGAGPSEPGAEPVRFGIEATRNTVIIRGPRDQVLKMRKILQTIDREPQHVLIEVLFLEVSADALESLNIAIADFFRHRIGNLSTNIGSESLRAFTFNFNRAPDAFVEFLRFRGSIDLLYRKNLARVIARPYLASLTGKTSALKITEDRSIVVQSVEGGAAVASTKEISSGVELKITPTVHLSGSINMQIDVEESEFIPTTGNVASSKNTNRAQNIMQVGSGESIIIGGLMLNKRQWTKAGLPWLREVPILNIFAAAQRRTEVDKEVLVVVTPHLYSPGLRTPLPFLEVFQKDPIIKYTTPTERLEFDK